jgi:hypothetical protein
VITDEIVHVVTVWHLLVPAGRTVLMSTLVIGAVVVRRTGGGVAVADGNRVTLHVAPLVAVKLAVVQVVDVVVVAYGRVPAGGAVLMVVLVAHGSPFS